MDPIWGLYFLVIAFGAYLGWGQEQMEKRLGGLREQLDKLSEEIDKLRT